MLVDQKIKTFFLGNVQDYFDYCEIILINLQDLQDYFDKFAGSQLGRI